MASYQVGYELGKTLANALTEGNIMKTIDKVFKLNDAELEECTGGFTPFHLDSSWTFGLSSCQRK